MNENFNRHDLFRNAIPGYVFLIVLCTYYLFALQKPPYTLETLLGLLAAGFPIGFIVQSLYRAWHASSNDLRALEEVEGRILRERLQEINKSNILSSVPINSETQRDPTDREISWLLETFLILKNEEGYRSRAHEMVSRIHSIGGAYFGVLLGLILSLIVIVFHNCTPIDNLNICKIIVITSIWLVIALCFRYPVRNNTIDAFQLLARNFVRYKINDIVLFMERESKIATSNFNSKGQN